MSNSLQVGQLESLFRRFQPVLVAYARQYLRSVEDAREVVQDVFLGVWNNRDHLQLDESLKAYLFTATRNKALNHLRKRRLETVDLDAARPEAYAHDGEEGKLHAAELKALIYEEVNLLPDRCRDIFILSRQEGLSYKEIAARLDVSVKTVENQINIALKRLREKFYHQKEGRNLLYALGFSIFLLYLLKFLRFL